MRAREGLDSVEGSNGFETLEGFLTGRRRGEEGAGGRGRS